MVLSGCFRGASGDRKLDLAKSATCGQRRDFGLWPVGELTIPGNSGRDVPGHALRHQLQPQRFLVELLASIVPSARRPTPISRPGSRPEVSYTPFNSSQDNGFPAVYGPTGTLNETYIYLTGQVFLNAGSNSFVVGHDDGVQLNIDGIGLNVNLLPDFVIQYTI